MNALYEVLLKHNKLILSYSLLTPQHDDPITSIISMEHGYKGYITAHLEIIHHTIFEVNDLLVVHFKNGMNPILHYINTGVSSSIGDALEEYILDCLYSGYKRI